MEKLTAYKLNDGQIFDNYKDAKKKAESLYATALSKIAAKILDHGKHTDLMAFIDENLDVFGELNELREDKDSIDDFSK